MQESFNFELINDVLPRVKVFTHEELQRLDDAQTLFRQHLSEMSTIHLTLSIVEIVYDFS